MHDIIKDNNVTHVDFLSLDVEDHEPYVLQTLPEEEDGLTIDVILIENEKQSNKPHCHLSNLLRYPLWNRGYGLVGFHGTPQGDDLWVKMNRHNLWRTHLVHARNHTEMELARKGAYAVASSQYDSALVTKLLQRFKWRGRDS
uniref:Methyltransferase FkbM domain-containing protein n=1 Tax=Eutreptiella gymnastica TaxID=73025 RepID=A0A7S1HZQ9_9EUGL